MKTPVPSQASPGSEQENAAFGTIAPSTQPRAASRNGRQRRPGRLASILGWCWRFVVGPLLCFNLFIFSYVTSIVVVGWTYRWMQGLVLGRWWKESRFAGDGSFADYCDTLGPNAPVTRPRWFLQERIGMALTQPRPDGRRPGFLRTLLRALRVPWHSLGRNFWIGCQGLLCTYALTGWGCLIMLFAWEFGWLNSFNKGYEMAFVGPLTGFLGIFLFIAALFYVPMAQVHQAVTGDYRAFFDFRFVWRLIQARPLAYVGLAACITFLSFFLQGLKSAPAFFDGSIPSWTEATDQEVLVYLRRYLHASSVVLFGSLLLVRYVASRVYSKAVLRAVRGGCVTPAELHPVLADWLQRLEMLPTPTGKPRRMAWGTGSVAWWVTGAVGVVVFVVSLAALFLAGPVGWLLVFGGWVLSWAILVPFCLFRRGAVGQYLRFNGRRMVFGFLFWIWFGFVVQIFVAEFVNYHPFLGFMNHSLIQFPCFDFIPGKLQASAGS